MAKQDDFKRVVTIGEKYGPAMEITEQAEADAYFERCVRHMMTFGRSRAQAEKIERENLAYFAGYYDNQTRERVERLFRCAHLVFGSISENGAPTVEDAKAHGRAAARLNRGARRGQAGWKPAPLGDRELMPDA